MFFILPPNPILLHPSTALPGNMFENYGTLNLIQLEVVFPV